MKPVDPAGQTGAIDPLLPMMRKKSGHSRLPTERSTGPKSREGKARREAGLQRLVPGITGGTHGSASHFDAHAPVIRVLGNHAANCRSSLVWRNSSELSPGMNLSDRVRR